MLGAYIQSNWSQTPAGDCDLSKLYSCPHVNAIVSWVSHKIIPMDQMPNDYSPTYREDVAFLLSEYMVGPSVPLVPGSWILSQVKHPFKSGHLLFYLSEYEGIYIFSKCKSTSGRLYLYCFLCPRSRSCTHIAFALPTPFDQLDDSASSNETLTDTDLREIEDDLLSKARYPFDIDTDPELRLVIQERTFQTLHEWYEAAVPGGVLKAEQQTCCNTPCYFINANRQGGACELFSLHGFAILEPIQASVCHICRRRYDFDGRSLGILNYANRYLFTVELLLDLLEFKALSGTPTHAYWQARCNTMLKPWTRQETLRFKKTWMNLAGRVNGIMTAFLSLVDYPENHFQCCQDPEIVCIDGIVLSVESKRIKTTTPWVDPHPLRFRFTKKEDRYIVVLSPNQKQVLKNYIRTGVFMEDIGQLAAEIGGPFGRFLLSSSVVDQSNPRLVQCHSLLKRFYRSLYKWISPACSIAPYATWPILEEIIDTNRVPFNCFSALTELAPVLSEIVSYLTTVGGHRRKYQDCIALLELILGKAQDCFEPTSTSYQSPIRPVNTGERVYFASATEEVLQTGAYFPGRPYHSIVRDIHLTTESAVCNKLYKKKGRLGAGTLLFWCGEHRKCLGFYVMPSAESCKTVFTILTTRFPKQPRVIIYDNGCNLSEYILNRAPLLFKETYILSDGFHWKNHINCGEAYNSKLYPMLNSNNA